MIENICVNFKTLLLMFSAGMALHGCATVGKTGSEAFDKYASAQQVIDQKILTKPMAAPKNMSMHGEPSMVMLNRSLCIPASI